MFFVKKFLPDKVKYDRCIHKFTSAFGELIEGKIKLSEKIEAVNQWCSQYPRRMFGIGISFFIICFVMSFLIPSGKDSGANLVSGLQDLGNGVTSLSAMSRVSDSRLELETVAASYMKDVEADITLIDSLRALPRLSREDSILLFSTVCHLRVLTNNNINDEN